MRVLLDTDVILDFLLDRPPFSNAANDLLELNARGVIDCYVSSITPVNAFYVGRKVVGSARIRQDITELLDIVSVCPTTHASLAGALDLPFADYEDAVQHATAAESNLEAIVTRNIDDYKNATLQVFTPTELLSHLKSKPE